MAKLPPYLINQEGALQEWSWQGIKENYNHRHSSQLIMVWPYGEITPEKDSLLFNAALGTLAKKDEFNYENAGHGLLHAALIATRLKNNVSVDQKLLRLTKEDYFYNSLCSSHYNSHGVFCTDVCNTTPAIMMEMLVYSAPGVLELLPALPQSLIKGSISGIKCRSRMTIEKLSWDMKQNRVTCTLTSNIEQKITIIQRKGIDRVITNAQVASSSIGKTGRILLMKKEKRITLTLLLHKTKMDRIFNDSSGIR